LLSNNRDTNEISISKRVSGGAISGIVIVSIVVIALIAAAFHFLGRRNSRRKQSIVPYAVGKEYAAGMVNEPGAQYTYGGYPTNNGHHLGMEPMEIYSPEQRYGGSGFSPANKPSELSAINKPGTELP